MLGPAMMGNPTGVLASGGKEQAGRLRSSYRQGVKFVKISRSSKRIVWGIGLSAVFVCAAAALPLVTRHLSPPPAQKLSPGKPARGVTSSATAVTHDPVSQSSPQFDLLRNVIGGGGGTSGGGSFSESGTIAEASASNKQTGGQFTMDSGFWNTLDTPTPTSTPTPTPTPTPTGNVVQFSSSNYTVQEDCTTVTITVNRIGDASGTASVDYATSDVTATERKDYITALGKLVFAPGETSKSFAVLINEDSYVEGNETFDINLSNPSGSTLGAPAVAVVTIIDDPSEPATNPIDDPQNYVCQHYHDFLNRQPDAAGLAFWTNEISSCGTDAQCIEIKRINVSGAFYLSIEFQQTGYLVERLYKTAFGSASGASTFGGSHQLPVPDVRLNEFLSDTQKIGQGVVVGQANWEQILENNKQAFTADFVQRLRFNLAFPTAMTAAQFVDTLNGNAGNPLSQTERGQLITDLSDGAKSRAQILRAIAEHPNLVNAEFNRAFVLMQYFGYLRRNPNDPPDSDYTGYDFWLTKLNQFNGN